MNGKTNKYAKPYPKSYIIAAVAFAVLLCGVWWFYGTLYQKDMQVINHCKVSSLANTIEKNVEGSSPDLSEARLAFKEINTLAVTFELNDVESDCLTKLSEKMKPLEKVESAEDVSANELLDAEVAAKRLSQAAQENAEIVMATSKKSHITGDYFMMTLFFVVLAAIFFIGHFVRKKESALVVKEQEKKKLEGSVQRAKDKVFEAAYKNLLMDCGNRYALGEDVSKQIKGGNQFCMAQLNLPEFDNLISMFGYDHMDNCMVDIAKAIQKQFEDSGSLYSVNDNSFVFLFNKEATINEITNKAERIRQTITSVLQQEIHISVPVNGAILCTNHFNGKNTDKILTKLHEFSFQSNPTMPLPVV